MTYAVVLIQAGRKVTHRYCSDEQVAYLREKYQVLQVYEDPAPSYRAVTCNGRFGVE